MKIVLSFIWIVGVSMVLGCSSQPKRIPSALTGIHYVITLHGLRGDGTSFGDFHSLIKLHLEQVDPGFTVVPINLIYKTALLDFSPHTVANQINANLDEKITQLNPEDKISIVAYSMGGQVGSIWYFNALKSEKYKKYALQTTKFISLGSPFWGSKEASVGISVENLFGQLTSEQLINNVLEKTNLRDTFLDSSRNREKALSTIVNVKKYLRDYIKNYDKNILPKSKISFAELSAVSLGSEVTNEIRLNHINYKNNTKWIGISTLVNCFETNLDSNSAGCQNKLFKKLNFDMFGKYAFGHTRRETDNSVITPSANARFLFALENDGNYADGYRTLASDFRYSAEESNHRFYLAEGLHSSMMTESQRDKALKILSFGGDSWESFVEDVVVVYEKNCKTAETCKHPSYKYIVKELADCDRENSTCEKKSEKNYIQAFFKDKEKYGEEDQRVLRSELHGFTLEINLRLPKGYDLSQINHRNIFSFLHTEFSDPEEHILQLPESTPYKILLARPLEIGSLAINKVVNSNDQDQLRVVMTGLIVPKVKGKYDSKSLENGANFELDIQLPGLKSRKIQALVRPYYSTYVDLVMAKKID